MRVVDTSAWIEWLLDTPVGRHVRPEIPETGQFVVPTIVQFELAKWLRREISDNAADEIIGYTQECIIAGLDTELALAAAALSSQHRLSTADAIIYATALAHNADLLTCDAHFKDLPGVIYFAKRFGCPLPKNSKSTPRPFPWPQACCSDCPSLPSQVPWPFA